MKDFVDILFADSSAITLDMKSAFGSKSRVRCFFFIAILYDYYTRDSLQTEVGRLSFARLVSAKRSTHKKVTEPIFYSLVQYFAIVLFESCDSEDYSPAKILMNMCFTFYHEGKKKHRCFIRKKDTIFRMNLSTVDVPGCEPYREYLYTYLREQPIWQSLRFWNAAIFDALQCERVRSILPTVYIAQASRKAAAAGRPELEAPQGDDNAPTVGSKERGSRATDADAGASTTARDSGDDASSSGQSGGADDENDDCSDDNDDNDDAAASPHIDLGLVLKRTRHRSFDRQRHDDRRADETKMHQNISFGQLG